MVTTGRPPAPADWRMDTLGGAQTKAVLPAMKARARTIWAKGGGSRGSIFRVRGNTAEDNKGNRVVDAQELLMTSLKAKRRDGARYTKSGNEEKLLTIQTNTSKNRYSEENLRVPETLEDVLVEDILRLRLVLLEGQDLQLLLSIVEFCVIHNDILVFLFPRRVHQEQDEADAKYDDTHDHTGNVEASPESSFNLVVAFAAVISLAVHAVIAHNNEKCLVIYALNHLANKLVHLAELGTHGGVIRSVSVTGMINTKTMSNEEVPVALSIRLQEGEDIVDNTVVDGVEIPDVKTVVSLANVGLEVAREERPPRVIAKVGNLLASILQLH
ncbi:hypothetical protein HG530_005294 [Fusarium avenaceum]|nr:hypothetical protein HG530_005294 [Fusarium avenaceum]